MGVAVAALVVGGTRVVYGVVGVPVSAGTSVALDVLAVAAVVAAYALAGRLAGAAHPLRALYTLLFASAGVLAAEWAVGAAVGISTQTRGAGLAAGPGVVLAGAGLGMAEAALAVAVAVALRPLVLYRRGRWTVGLWRLAGAAAVVSALGWAGQPADAPPEGARVAFDGAAVVCGLALVLRQRWVGVLTGRQRLAAAVLALALAAALVAVVVVRIAGPAGLPSGDVDRVPVAGLLSHSVSTLSALAVALGALYALTAGLVLVFQFPAAEPARAGERRAFQSLAGLSGGLLDRPALVAAIARGPVEAGLADTAWVALSDAATGSLTVHVAAAHGVDPADAAARVDVDALARAAADATLVLGRAEADHRIHARPGSGLGSLVVAALPAVDPSGSPAAGPHRGPARGALFAARRTPDAFEADDVAAVEAFAAQAALSLAHADLIATALDRERLARELALAREVQLRLFPQSLPEIAGLEMAAAERPALEVGGDYYDAVALSPTCAGVVVADVSGKGAGAAFHMAEMKGVFQVGARLTRAPAEFLCSASEALAPSLSVGTFVSAAYAVVDAEAGTLAVARAGHCPPVLSRDPRLVGGGARLLRSRGIALGLGSTALFRATLGEERVDLLPGDAVVLYTDGLVEARDAAGEEWGYGRLVAAVAEHRAETAAGLLAALLAAHRAWSALPDAPADDVTVVVLKWNGPDAV